VHVHVMPGQAVEILRVPWSGALHCSLTFRMTRRAAVGVDAAVRGRYSHLAFCRADVTLTSTLAYSDDGLAV
jgi:hypothetical protein